MRVHGVFLDAKCPSPPSAVGSHRTVGAASRSGVAGTQVAASEGRFRGNVSPKVVDHLTVAAVPETRSSSWPEPSAAVAFHVRRSARAGSVCLPLAARRGPAAATHLTNCCSRSLTQPRRCSRSVVSASNSSERHR